MQIDAVDGPSKKFYNIVFRSNKMAKKTFDLSLDASQQQLLLKLVKEISAINVD